jgi:predicted nucleotidyltransferase
LSALGICAEYNPFHNGHLFHLRESQRRLQPDFTYAVVNGNFSQRGECAIADKFCRTKMALNFGIDVVIENPLLFATASAESFALSAVTLLDAAGVTHMSFGVESGDMDLLKQITEVYAKDATSAESEFKRLISKGLPYHMAKEYSHYILRQYHDIISKPNHILAIEYLRAIKAINSRMQPMAVRRSDNDSSTSIRQKIIMASVADGGAGRNEAEQATDKYDMPEKSLDILRDSLRLYGVPRISRLDGILFYLLCAKDLEYIKSISGMNDGLAERFVKLAPFFDNSVDLLAAVKTRRHSHARLKRAALSLILGITARTREQYKTPLYLRVLGCRNADALRHLIKHAALPVVVNTAKTGALPDSVQKMLLMETSSTDIYNLCREKKIQIDFEEYRQKVVIFDRSIS